MPFKLNHGIRSELYMRTDIANILESLEPIGMRTGYEQGWLEALRRVGMACGIRYVEPTSSPDPRLIEAPRSLT